MQIELVAKILFLHSLAVEVASFSIWSRQRPCLQAFLAAHKTCTTQSDLLNKVQEVFAESVVNFDVYLQRVKNEHQADCRVASTVLAVEDLADSAPKSPLTYEWVHMLTTTEADNLYPVAIRSLNHPLLSNSDISTLVSAAEALWNQSPSGTSRFTYQRPGNYEAHLTDLGEEAIAVMNHALQEKIYPTIRDAFYPDDTSFRLCIYDSILIRYNATKARESLMTDCDGESDTVVGAGQPLHRDLGLVSVNIMLNDGFTGGGTFFENQLRGDMSQHLEPLKPVGTGHCLMHKSHERHAGASTVSGVRDVLVIFVMGDGGISSTDHVPHELLNARLKQCRDVCDQETPNKALACRVAHQILATQAKQDDGEAYQYLGTALMEYGDQLSKFEDPTDMYALAADCMRKACELSPCDARNYNNLGLILGRLHSFHDGRDTLVDDIETTFKQGLKLLEVYANVGCDVERDLDAIRLNYGLHLANLDRFEQSCHVLEPLTYKKKKDQYAGNRVVDDAFRLYNFCKSRI